MGVAAVEFDASVAVDCIVVVGVATVCTLLVTVGVAAALDVCVAVDCMFVVGVVTSDTLVVTVGVATVGTPAVTVGVAVDKTFSY